MLVMIILELVYSFPGIDVVHDVTKSQGSIGPAAL